MDNLCSLCILGFHMNIHNHPTRIENPWIIVPSYVFLGIDEAMIHNHSHLLDTIMTHTSYLMGNNQILYPMNHF